MGGGGGGEEERSQWGAGHWWWIDEYAGLMASGSVDKTSVFLGSAQALVVGHGAGGMGAQDLGVGAQD